MPQLPKRLITLSLVLAAAVAGKGFVAQSNRGSSRPDGEAPAAPFRAFGPVHPRLSERGDQIVFSYQGALWRMARSGGVMTRLTGGPGFDVEPTWSPDGRRVAYIQSAAFANGPLRIIDAQDGTPVPLANEITASEPLMFNADGTRILGTFQPVGQGPALGWFHVETGDLTPVRTPGVRPHRYALAHDGRSIAFTTTQDLPGEQSGNNGPEADLWTVPAEGGEPRKLVRFPARIHNLCWGAGDRVLYAATELGGVHNDLWEIPLADPERSARRLTFGQADEDRPSASNDGRWLLYTDNHLGATALVVRDLASGQEQIVEVTRLDYRRPTGRLVLGLVDDSDGSPLTARVAVRHSEGNFHAPPGSLYRLHRGSLHFYAQGNAELDLPEGQYDVSVAHGPEYRVARISLEIKPGQTATRRMAIERWTDQRSQGWYSGESHIHANYGYGPWYNSPRTMLLQCEGEDLCVCNFMVANSDGDGVFDREYFRGRPDPLSSARNVLYWNEEFRSTIWGHMTLLHLSHLVEPIYTGFRSTTHPWDSPSNADVADLTHDQDGLVNYTHPAQNVQDPYATAYSAKSLPLDVAIGKIDSIDVMGSNHEANMPLWYRLLNCGFRLPASAGTDCFLNRVPSRLPGSDRVYVRVEDPFSYDRWIAGLKAGRTFVTNGPMLQFTADGHGPGEIVPLEPEARIRIRGRATSQFPLDRLEVVRNGQVVAESNAAGDRLSATIDRDLAIDRSGWVALRVSGPSHPDQASGAMFAHSSPIYLEVSGHPAQARADAEYFLAWIDRLADDIHRRDRLPSRSRPHIEDQFRAARAVYERMRGER